MATVVEVLAKLRADTGQFNSAMQNAAGTLNKAGQSMTSIGGSLTRAVTLPLVGIGTAAVITATQFESSMAKIVGLVGIAADEVDGMRDSVLQISGATAKSPIELADALFVVTSAGLRGENAMGALDNAARASAAGLGQTTDIARALAGAMNAYGADTLDAARATDVIVATARAGNFETSQFAAAIGRVLPFAKQAGASFEDMGGAVALLTRTNGDAAQSVTQMAALFRAFVVPSEQAKTAFEEVGLSAADMRQMIAEDGLPQALQYLDDALGGNREQLGRLLGSSEAASAAFQILEADASTLEATFGEVNAAAGITDEAFAAVENTTGFKLQKAMANFKNVLIEIGDVLAPLVQKVSDFFSDMMARFQGLPDGVKQGIVAMAGIAAAIGPVLLIAGKLTLGISSLMGVLGGAGGGAGLAGALTALTGPIGIAIAAIAGLVLIFVGLWRESETFREAVMSAFNQVKDAISGAVDTIKGALSDNASAVDTLRMVFKGLGDFIGSVIIPLYANYLSAVIKGAAIVFGLLIAAVGKLADAFRASLPYVLNFAAEAMRVLGNMVDFILGGIETLLAGLATLADLLGLGDTLGKARDAVAAFRKDVADKMGEVEQVYRDAAVAATDWGNETADAHLTYRDAAVRARAETEEYRDAAVRAADSALELAGNTDVLAAVTDTATAATMALNDAYAALTAYFSETAAMDRAYTLLQDFNEQVASNTAGFDGYSEAAMANRDAFMQWANAQITAAQGLDDPIARLDELKRIQQEARDALVSQGIKPAESEFYQGIKDTVAAAQQEVEGMQDAVDVAKERGLDVASAIAQGVAQGMSAQASALNAAGAAGGDTVADGLNSSLGISSPSRIAMVAGRNTSLGLIEGLRDMDISVRANGMLSGTALVDGMIAGLNNRSGSLYARVRAIVAAAIAAANSAAGATSADPPPTSSGTTQTTTGLGPRSAPTNITVNVTSASGEPAATTVPRALRRAAWVAGLNG